MRKLRLAKAVPLLLALALVATACGGGGGGGKTAAGGGSKQGVKGGKLRIFTDGDVDSLDPQIAYYTFSYEFLRAFVRQLYSFDSQVAEEKRADPVPDLSDGAPQVSSDNLTYTFKIRSGVKWAPPVNRDVTAADFVNGFERLYDKTQPSPGQQYGNLIKGAKEFGDGKAKTISGVQANGQELKITLAQPAADFLSILALPFFAPVPEELSSDHALKPGGKYKVGPDYSNHPASNGPYVVDKYTPNKLLTLKRNPNWDAATDPLRKAWVDSIDMKEGVDAEATQQAIESGDADLQGDTAPPVAALPRLARDPQLSKRFADVLTGCNRYLALVTNPNAGPIGNLKVRQAVEYAVNKESFRRARGGPFAGDFAGGILTPASTVGYTKYDPYPTPNNQGDPAKAKQLLAEAGYPNGVTLSLLGVSTGFGPGVNTALQSALAAAGIKLKIKALTRAAQISEEGLPAHNKDHNITVTGWCPDWPGDNARSWFKPLLDGRNIQKANNQNTSEYNNPKMNSLIDQALAELDKSKRAALWQQADKLAMQDAVWVSVLLDKTPYTWSARVKNWTYTTWTNSPDLTQLWLDPNTP